MPRILRVTLTLVGAYLVVLAPVLTIAPLAAIVAHAKWAPMLVAGLVSGALVRPTVREATVASGVFAVVLAAGWTAFSALSGKLDAARALSLLVASVPVMLVAAAWGFAGLLVAGWLRARAKAS